jgi:hypothetical protein
MLSYISVKCKTTRMMHFQRLFYFYYKISNMNIEMTLNTDIKITLHTSRLYSSPFSKVCTTSTPKTVYSRVHIHSTTFNMCQNEFILLNRIIYILTKITTSTMIWLIKELVKETSWLDRAGAYTHRPLDLKDVVEYLYKFYQSISMVVLGLTKGSGKLI